MCYISTTFAYWIHILPTLAASLIRPCWNSDKYVGRGATFYPQSSYNINYFDEDFEMNLIPSGTSKKHIVWLNPFTEPIGYEGKGKKQLISILLLISKSQPISSSLRPAVKRSIVSDRIFWSVSTGHWNAN